MKENAEAFWIIKLRKKLILLLYFNYNVSEAYINPRHAVSSDIMHSTLCILH